MILIVGATAFFGRQTVETLVDRGVPVRALTRRPESAGLPAGAEVVAGDLNDPSTLGSAVEGVTAVLLVLPFGLDPAALLRLIPGRKIVVLSSGAVGAGEDVIAAYHAGLERQVAQATDDWTALRLLFPAINSLGYAQQLAGGDVVTMPYPSATTTAVHELDVAEAAAAVLTTDGHAGKVYDLTGPASLTLAGQVAAIAAATGRPIEVEAEDPESVLRRLSMFMDPGFAAALLSLTARTVTHPQAPNATVEELTGHAPRPYAEWVAVNFR